jgi:DDE superfamily endonuclease
MVPLVAFLGRRERRAAATGYVQGLLMPGQRKSIEPMAERLGVPSQRLQQFVADSPWDENTLWGLIRRRVLPHLEPIEAWIVDSDGLVETGAPFGRGGPPVLRGGGQAGQLSGERGIGGQRWGGGRPGERPALLAPKLDRRLRPAAPKPGCRPKWPLPPSPKLPWP